MSSRIRRGALGFAAIVSCAVATPAAGLAAWSAPQAAATTYGSYQHIVLRSNVAGDVVLAWQRRLEDEGPGCVEAVTREGPTTWTPPALLNREGEDMYPGSVGAAIDGRGEATVAWISPTGDFHGELRAAGGSASSGWRRSRLVAASEEADDETQLLLDAREHTEIVFLASSYSGSGWVRTVSLGAGGRRGPTHTIYSRKSAFFPGDLRVATDGHGETFVAWLDEGRTATVQVLVLASNGKPEGPVRTFTKRGGHLEGLQVTTNQQGDALLAWRRRGPARVRGIEVARRTRGGRFSRATRVSRTLDSQLTSAVEPDGHMALLFTHRLGHKATAVEIISTSGTGWTTQHPLAPSSPSTSTYGPRLAANPVADELLAVWTTAPTEPPGLPIAVSTPGREVLPPNACAAKPLPYTPAPEDTTSRIEASMQIGESGWQPPAVLSDGGHLVALTISPAGRALAAWTKESRQKETIYVSEYEPPK